MAIINIKVFVSGTTAIDVSTSEGFEAKTNGEELKENEEEIIKYLKMLEIFLKGYKSYKTDTLNR